VPNRKFVFVTRRELLVWVGASGASAALTAGCGASATMPPPPAPMPPYFTADERAVLGALADAVLPPDDVPGGNALGAVDYIERLLTALSQETPPLYAGGPYSDRNPVPKSSGGAGAAVPNEFASFLPLDRVSEQAWKLRILGSSGVSGGGPNDAVLGPVVGLRDAVAGAIQQAKAALPPNAAPDALTAEERASLLASLDKGTQDTLVELVLEGAFTAPEYGGNKSLAGCAMCHFEGDSMPYGYSTFDTASGKYHEHPEAPCSTADPGPDPMPMD